MWTQDMFGVEKPIIALLHLDALPGDPGYCGDMKTVTEHARKDLLALQDGGVDGILLCKRIQFAVPAGSGYRGCFGYGVYHRKIKRRDQRTVWR